MEASDHFQFYRRFALLMSNLRDTEIRTLFVTSKTVHDLNDRQHETPTVSPRRMASALLPTTSLRFAQSD